MTQQQREAIAEVRAIKQAIREAQIRAAARQESGAELRETERRFMRFYRQQQQAIKAAYDVYFAAV
jgi:molybdenum-dependent DNA-binding transcriptional regulator ModE